MMHGYGDTFTTAELRRNTGSDRARPGLGGRRCARPGARVALLRPWSRLAYELTGAGGLADRAPTPTTSMLLRAPAVVAVATARPSRRGSAQPAEAVDPAGRARRRPRRSRPPRRPGPAPAAGPPRPSAAGCVVDGEGGGGVEQHGVADRAASRRRAPGVRRRRCGGRRRPRRSSAVRRRDAEGARVDRRRRHDRRRAPATTCDVVVVVSSSSPSSPRNTQASTPRRASTPAMIGAIRGSAQPIAWAAGLTGLASGPRKLNVVRDRRARGAARRRGAAPGGRPPRSRT